MWLCVRLARGGTSDGEALAADAIGGPPGRIGACAEEPGMMEQRKSAFGYAPAAAARSRLLCLKQPCF
jgi:hypothetical protein